MSFRPALVALDVDGTLVDWDNVMAPAVRAAVRAVADAGVPVVVSTGRAVPGVMDAVDKLGLESGSAVASNGAVTVGYRPVEVLDTVTFDASETVRLLLEQVPDAAVAVEEVGHGYRVNRNFPSGELTGTVRLQSVAELVAEPVTRVIIRSPDQSAEEFVALAERLGLHGTNYYVGYTAWLDLAPEGVSKAYALAKLAASFGVAQSQVLAIGDGRNDVEMLAWAGRGVAMGQSPLEVQACADDVTGSLAADGVVTELSRWF